MPLVPLINPFEFNETETRKAKIDPILESKGWQFGVNMRFEYTINAGRIIIDGIAPRRDHPKKADYVLFNSVQSPIAIVEAKKYSRDAQAGIQQVREYAEQMNVKFAFATNGDKIIFINLFTQEEREITADEFPTPTELAACFNEHKQYTPEQLEIVEQQYYFDEQTGKEPRYYQRIAIDRTIEAVAKGVRRAMVVMATGTGKTYTAFQILWRLLKSKAVSRVLYLADRNILIDQTMTQDFEPLNNIMTKIQGRNSGTEYQVYMSLYQQLIDNNLTEGEKQPFERMFKPGFFDLIIVDECHRGSAKDDSEWRKILDYFSGAVQLGMTATPKCVEGSNNVDYFGKPLYEYSLKQGIQDGFLAPYRITRSHIHMNARHLEGEDDYIVTKEDEKLSHGEIQQGEVLSRKDMGREVLIDARERLVAERITKMLHKIGRMTKTIVFCPTQQAAASMRQHLINCNRDMMSRNQHYIMRITSDDAEGKKQLDNFISIKKQYPVVVTTSEMLSTGVDAKTTGLIVIDKEIESIIAFKQIIGRGTRVVDYVPKNKKLYFDILDFRDATRLFADPDFDGDPANTSIDVPIDGSESSTIIDPPESPINTPVNPPIGPTPTPHSLIRIKGNKRSIIIDREEKLVLGEDGKPIEKDYLDFVRSQIKGKYLSLEKFINDWNSEEKMHAITQILREFEDLSVSFATLRELYSAEYEGYDEFDIICNLAFGRPMVSRKERAELLRKKKIFAKYSGTAREVINALLDRYAEEGVSNTLENRAILATNPFNMIGKPNFIATQCFGGQKEYERAIRELEYELYSA